MQVQVLFDQSGNRAESDSPTGSLGESIQRLRAAQDELRRLSVDDLISLFDEIARAWSSPRHSLAATLRENELGFLTLWMRERNLRRICDLALHGSRHCLDEFCSLSPVDARVFKAQPRGLIVHWVAGNVPVLGIISVVQGLLTKNANLVKVPASDRGLLPALLNSMRGVSCVTASGMRLDGATLTNAVCAVYADRQDREAARQMSLAADVRLAWGGRDAVEAIMSLPRKFGTEDIIHGPKLSFAVVGAEKLAGEEQARAIARSIARDASAFDQRGCNSPHTVFVEAGGVTCPQDFAKLLAREMDTIHRRQPLRVIAPSETVEILAQRAEYAMQGTAWHSEGMGWSVLFSENGRGLGGPCYARTLFVRPVSDVFDTVPFCSGATQTVGLALGDRRLALANALTARGVERCPEVGSMSLYDAPWDGLFPIGRMVRWVSAS